MTRRVCVALCLFFILVAAFSMPKWETDKIINGMTCEKSRVTSSGKIICKLSKKEKIGGYCYKDWVHLERDYSVVAGYLGESVYFHGIWIPENTWIEYHKEYFSCSFPYMLNIHGYSLSGSRLGPEGIRHSFYYNGKIKTMYSNSDLCIQGVPCKGGSSNLISFDDSGVLESCTLSKNVQIGSVYFKKYDKYTKE